MIFLDREKGKYCRSYITYDALQKRKPFLDQLMEGLEEFLLGTATRLFPHLFQPLFVSVKKYEPEDVIQILCPNETLRDCQQVVYQYLKEFLRECDHNRKLTVEMTMFIGGGQSPGSFPPAVARISLPPPRF